MKYQCPVCGFPDLTEAPRGKSGGGSYEICPSCGFQFGVSDDDEGITYAKWLADWKKNGMKWTSKQTQPEGWNPVSQLKSLKSKLKPSKSKPSKKQ